MHKITLTICTLVCIALSGLLLKNLIYTPRLCYGNSPIKKDAKDVSREIEIEVIKKELHIRFVPANSEQALNWNHYVAVIRANNNYVNIISDSSCLKSGKIDSRLSFDGLLDATKKPVGLVFIEVYVKRGNNANETGSVYTHLGKWLVDVPGFSPIPVAVPTEKSIREE